MNYRSALQPGTRIYYTGDMANGSSFGTVTAYRDAGRFNPESVDISFDDERFEGDEKKSTRSLPVICFAPGPGRRFWLESEWEADRQARIAEMKARYSRLYAHQ